MDHVHDLKPRAPKAAHLVRPAHTSCHLRDQPMMFTLKTVASLFSPHSRQHRPQGVSRNARPGAAVPFLLLLAMGAITPALLPTPAHAQCDGPPQLMAMQGVDRGAQTIALLPNGDVVVNVAANNSGSAQFSTASRAAGVCRWAPWRDIARPPTSSLIWA